MQLRKIILYHFLPAALAALLGFFIILRSPRHTVNIPYLNSRVAANMSYADKFTCNDLNQQVALSLALKRRIPVLMGSSELTSGHLKGLAQNFFTRQKGDRFLSFGHAGFQNLAILAVLAANRPLLKHAKVCVILSPGWFEKQYSSGTSLSTFFEYCTPNYLHQIYQDDSIPAECSQALDHYVQRNFDKISKPDAVLRLMDTRAQSAVRKMTLWPFTKFTERELKKQEEEDLYLTSQERILASLNNSTITPYRFKPADVQWDSLETASLSEFRSVSTNNDLGVENGYYDKWLKNKKKKRLEAVAMNDNRELKDLETLLGLFTSQGANPIFVMLPFNKNAHDDVAVLLPIIKEVNQMLDKHHFKYFDMYTPNAINYRNGILEDIMHPYNAGWYQIDKFIIENFHD
jgi:D-alanyl-lipoteichoic acid biosynthesis protein DltD